jgi:hypothetical protein
MIAERLVKLGRDDIYMSELATRLDPKATREVWYEDLSDLGAVEDIATWLWNGLGGGAPRPEADRTIALGRKLDEAEARAIKRRFLASADAGRWRSTLTEPDGFTEIKAPTDRP